MSGEKVEFCIMRDCYNDLYIEQRWIPLLPGLEIAVSRRHRFTTDSVLLSRFAVPRPGDRCADLGAGCGAVSLLWFGRDEPLPAMVHCVELDPEAVQLLRESVARNRLTDRIFPLCGDLRDLKSCSALQPNSLDLTVSNPPYFPAGPARERDSARHTARRESAVTIGEVCACASRLLRQGGRFCCCWRPERLPDLFAALRENSLEPKRLRTAAVREGLPPFLTLVEAVRGGGKELCWMPPLLLNGPDGRPSTEYRTIYRMEG